MLIPLWVVKVETSRDARHLKVELFIGQKTQAHFLSMLFFKKEVGKIKLNIFWQRNVQNFFF